LGLLGYPFFLDDLERALELLLALDLPFDLELLLDFDLLTILYPLFILDG